ncbi:histone-like nucleoid-structuring protein Lsr2 [Dermacoccus abyssi]
MAQRIVVILEDDLDGTKASETITFALDGVTYEIDLNDENASQLRSTFASWVGAARRISGRKQQAKAPTDRRGDLNEIRAWARKNGHTVSDRGRIPGPIVQAYDSAHSPA